MGWTCRLVVMISDNFTTINYNNNKNDNILENKVQDIRWSDDQKNIDKFRLAANITEYHIISKLMLSFLI